MDNPENWVWIWLLTAVGFGVGEILTAGSFFLLPFAVGAAASFGAAALGAGLALQWILFLALSIAAFAALRPIAHRLDRDYPDHGIGANYLRGSQGMVMQGIAANNAELGMVRVERQEWRAESLDGRPIEAGTLVKVAEVRGTRVVVFPVEIGTGDHGEPDLTSEP
jgi:membrane protein implicated in regulation of membrane protease activity